MKKTKIKKYFNVIIGTLIMAATFNLFFLSNNLAAFGISGLSIVVNDAFGLNPSVFILVSNGLLILLSYFVLGSTYTKKTIFGAILFPVCIELTSFLPQYVSLDNTEMLAIALVGGFLTGFGGGLIYKEDFGTAGTDITNEIIHRYAKITLGKAMLIGDGMVVLLGGFVFGLQKMLYSLIVLFVMTTVCNKVMINIKRSKSFFVISTEEKKIKDYLLNVLHNDVTIMKCEGGRGRKTKILFTIVDYKDYFRLKEGILAIDKKAFITVTDSYDVENKNIKIKEKEIS